MKFDLKSIVATVAPGIATMLGGPLAGMAVKKLSEHFLGKADASEDEIVAAIQGASPEQLIELKRIDKELTAQLTEAGIRFEEIDSADRDSARQREMALRDRVPAMLAGGVTLGFFGVLGYMLLYGLPEQGEQPLLVMLGSLGTAWSGIIAYYFGSSAGSKAKDRLIDKATNQA